MKIAYFDTISGISGDMTLAAFISASVSLDELTDEIKKLNLQGIELEAARIERSGISAIKLDVVISAPQHHHRHLKDIFKIIDEGNLNQKVKETSKNIFMELAKAEAKVHSQPIEKVHFHEVGALDSIVDIVGAAICIDKLGIEKIFSSPIKLGSGGFVETEHGKLPIPSPAAVEILKGYPTIFTDIPFELTTPTGAAIVKAMSDGVLSSERIKIENVGYGAGTREISQIPNLLRIVIGEMIPAYDEDEVVIIESNIDDMNPEIYPYVIERLLSSNALDVYLVPIIMKKGRPGFILSAICDRSNLDEVLSVFYRETTTIGVRILPLERRKVGRIDREVQTSFGLVKVKAITSVGYEKPVPEYEECKRIAREKNIPLVEVYQILERELKS